MITLTRRVNETVLINDDIRVTVIHLRDQRVRLQIDAPSNVSVRRERVDFEVSDEPASEPSAKSEREFVPTAVLQEGERQSDKVAERNGPRGDSGSA